MGFPHSEIFGSKCAGNSPKLIAACHVLHRLSVPRHPPNALIVLNSHVLSAKRRSCDRRFRLVPCRGRPPQQNGHDLPVGVAALRNSAQFDATRLSDLFRFTMSKNELCSYPMVEADGIEPTTSCLQSRRSPN